MAMGCRFHALARHRSNDGSDPLRLLDVAAVQDEVS